MWVWKPNILSREKSFHQRKEIRTTKIVGTKTIIIENFMLMYKTVFPSKEKRAKETNKGQKDVWTARNGEKKISTKQSF